MLRFGLKNNILLRFFAELIPLRFPVSAIARFIQTTYFYLCCCILTFLELMINQLLYAKKTHSMKQCILLLFKDIFSIICVVWFSAKKRQRLLVVEHTNNIIQLYLSCKVYLLILLPVAIHSVTKYLIFPLKTLKCDKMTACLSFAKHVGCNGYKLFCQIIFVCKRSI